MRRVDLLEEFSDDRCCWVGEAEELVVIPILVPTANGESESFALDRNVPSSVFGNDLFRLDAMWLQFIDEILSEPLAPESWVDLLFFAIVRRELNRISVLRFFKISRWGELTSTPATIQPEQHLAIEDHWQKG
jgi:hypothetical protein